MKKLDKELDHNFDSNLDNGLDNMKKQISEYKLSDEFKANLKLKLDKEYEEVNKPKITNKLNFFPRQLVTALACLIVIFSTCAFADGIGNYISKYLSNTDKELQEAIENGKVQNVDMDFIKTDDLSIRVSQLVVEDNNLYIVFDVLTEEEWDRIYIDEMKIHDENGNLIYDNYSKTVGNEKLSRKQYEKNRFLLLYAIEHKDYKNIGNTLEVMINRIKLKNDYETKSITEQLIFKIDINVN